MFEGLTGRLPRVDLQHRVHGGRHVVVGVVLVGVDDVDGVAAAGDVEDLVVGGGGCVAG